MMLILGLIIGILVGVIAGVIGGIAIIAWNCANSDKYYAAFDEYVNDFRD